jgi:hypothetical protein
MGGLQVNVDVNGSGRGEGMSGGEVLRLFGRFEPLHLPLSSSRRPMQVLGPVVQISALPVLDAGQQVTPSDT